MAKKKAAAAAKPQVSFDLQNSCVHDERNLAAIETSLREFGAGRSILIDAENIVRAGNGTLQTSQKLGLPVRVIESDGTELIAIKRIDLSGSRAVAAGLADNRASDLHSYDSELLREQLIELEAELPDLNFEALGLSDNDVAAMLISDAPEADDDTSNSSTSTAGDLLDDLVRKAFVLTKSQLARLNQALQNAAEEPFGNTGNNSIDGNALARIVESYLNHG
jgi:hypothetical protein